MQADEAPLTGESVPVEKQAATFSNADLPAGDRTNIAFAGTSVTYGRGQAVVVATAVDCMLIFKNLLAVKRAFFQT